jgi:hypothetical protein
MTYPNYQVGGILTWATLSGPEPIRNGFEPN